MEPKVSIEIQNCKPGFQGPSGTSTLNPPPPTAKGTNFHFMWEITETQQIRRTRLVAWTRDVGPT